MPRLWYKERYLVKTLKLEPIFGWRIKEEGTERIVAKEVIGIDADKIIAAHNAEVRSAVPA